MTTLPGEDAGARGLDPRFGQLVARLSEEFGRAVPVDEIDVCVAEIAANYADARIKTYVPVLLERQVRQRLREQVRQRTLP